MQAIKQLQLNGITAHCIVAVRENKPGKEAAFRNWFKDFFAAKYVEHAITAEEQLGNGRIDLKIHDTKHGSKIMEFKGWWNQGKHKLEFV